MSSAAAAAAAVTTPDVSATSHAVRILQSINELRQEQHHTKQPDGEVPVMLELWGMRSTSSLPLLPSPLWFAMVAPDKVPTIA